MATLPARPRPSGPVTLFDVTRLDQSGRLSGRALVRALGWRAGQRLDITVAGASIVVTASPAGRYALTARGELALPASARALSGIRSGEPVLLTADPTHGQLMMYPATAVAALLADLYTGAPAGEHVH